MTTRAIPPEWRCVRYEMHVEGTGRAWVEPRGTRWAWTLFTGRQGLASSSVDAMRLAETELRLIAARNDESRKQSLAHRRAREERGRRAT